MRVQPADDLTAAARPERVVRVLGEHQVVRAEAGADVRQLLRLGIVDGEVAAGALLIGNSLADGCVDPSLQKAGIVGRPHRRRDPHAALLVEHRVVDVVLAGPDRLVAPVRRGRGHLRRCRRRVRIAHVSGTFPAVAVRIEHRHVVGAQLERAVERPVGVHRRIAAIGRDHVVQVRLRIGPVPHRDDDVALDALRPRRRRRKLAGLDAVGPVGEHRESARGRSGSSTGSCSSPPGPTASRRSHACAVDEKVPSAAGISRVALLPSWWHARQVPFFICRSHSAWLRMPGAMPLPDGPVPGNSLLAGALHQREPVAGRVVLGRGARVRAR